MSHHVYFLTYFECLAPRRGRKSLLGWNFPPRAVVYHRRGRRQQQPVSGSEDKRCRGQSLLHYYCLTSSPQILFQRRALQLVRALANQTQSREGKGTHYRPPSEGGHRDARLSSLQAGKSVCPYSLKTTGTEDTMFNSQCLQTQ